MAISAPSATSSTHGCASVVRTRCSIRLKWTMPIPVRCATGSSCSASLAAKPPSCRTGRRPSICPGNCRRGILKTRAARAHRPTGSPWCLPMAPCRSGRPATWSRSGRSMHRRTSKPGCARRRGRATRSSMGRRCVRIFRARICPVQRRWRRLPTQMPWWPRCVPCRTGNTPSPPCPPKAGCSCCCAASCGPMARRAWAVAGCAITLRSTGASICASAATRTSMVWRRQRR